MKKYQMPNVEFVQVNAMQVIMEGSPTPDPIPDTPVGPIPGAPSRNL